MSHELDQAKARRGYLRWLILVTLNEARPVGAAETLVLVAVRGAVDNVSRDEIREHLDYLERRELVKVDRSEVRPQWVAELTRVGIDVVEYEVEVDAGIARPRKYY